jgi:hypothetical protein
MMGLKPRITRVNLKCVTQHLFQHQTHSSYPRTVSKAVDIDIQATMHRMGELAIVVMAMAEDIVVLRGHRKLTFLEAEDREGMEEDTIMAEEKVVGMVDVVIRGMVLVIRRGRFSFISVIVEQSPREYYDRVKVRPMRKKSRRVVFLLSFNRV